MFQKNIYGINYVLFTIEIIKFYLMFRGIQVVWTELRIVQVQSELNSDLKIATKTQPKLI